MSKSPIELAADALADVNEALHQIRESVPPEMRHRVWDFCRSVDRAAASYAKLQAAIGELDTGPRCTWCGQTGCTVHGGFSK